MPVQPGCIFCDDEPCVTHADKPGAKKPRKREAPRPVQTVSAPVLESETTTDDTFLTAPKVSRFDHMAATEAELSQDDLIFREAIRNLWPILSDRDKRLYKDLVDPPKTAAMLKRQSEVRRMLDENVRRFQSRVPEA